MEEKIQSVQYRDSEPSEFAHKPPKQEMDLSCSPGQPFVVALPLPGASILRSCPGGRGVHSARVTHLVDE